MSRGQWPDLRTWFLLLFLPTPPISAKKWFVFMGIEYGFRCKRLNLMKLFADMPK